MNNADDREEILKDLDHESAYLMGELGQVDELVGFHEVRAILDEEDCDLPADCLQDPLFLKFYGLVREGLLRLNQIAVALVKTGRLPESRNGEKDFAAGFSVFVPNGITAKSITLDEVIERFDHSPQRQHLR
ncbi:MAG TPA: hypothetical protein VFA51_06115, partial [Candidatus Udaeobacter sp.]|nr:hypothetical protein [Candidatus Udaeobacter sp.]